MSKTPRYDHDPIPLRNVGNDESVEKPGDFYWADDTLWVAIPSDDPEWDNMSIIRIACAEKQSPGVWQWDGDREKPTLTPSIHTIGVWHGWIKNGMLVEA